MEGLLYVFGYLFGLLILFFFILYILLKIYIGVRVDGINFFNPFHLYKNYIDERKSNENQKKFNIKRQEERKKIQNSDAYKELPDWFDLSFFEKTGKKVTKKRIELSASEYSMYKYLKSLDKTKLDYGKKYNDKMNKYWETKNLFAESGGHITLNKPFDYKGEVYYNQFLNYKSGISWFKNKNVKAYKILFAITKK